VIGLSASRAAANERRVRKACAHLEKPVDDEDLLAAIAASLR
jgi:hypothetical protein